MMRPFPGRNLPGMISSICFKFYKSIEPQAIFIYRLSHARRVIENDFGILAAR